MNRHEREQTPWTGALAPASRYFGTNNIADLIRDCSLMGLIDELWDKLGFEAKPARQAQRQDGLFPHSGVMSP
jgi:hypothetical protein